MNQEVGQQGFWCRVVCDYGGCVGFFDFSFVFWVVVGVCFCFVLVSFGLVGQVCVVVVVEEDGGGWCGGVGGFGVFFCV